MPAPAPAPGSTTTWWPAWASLRTISGTSATRRSPGAVSVGTPIRKGGNRSRTCDRVSVGLVGLLATFHPKSATADHHRAAASTLEIPGVFLRGCVLARWRRRPVFRVQRHEKTHEASAPMRLLVTGAAGMLGRDVAAAAESAGHDVIALARADLDITDAAAVRA